MPCSSPNEPFTAWVRDLGPAMVMYARTWAGRDEAEDVVQRVFVKLWTRKQWPAEPRAWLFRCVRNEAVGFRRSLRRRVVRERSAAAGESIFGVSVDARLDADAAQAALATLPAPQREIVVLRIWSGLTLDEVSTVTGLAKSTVHDQYRAALAVLKKRLEPNDKRKDD